MGRDSNSDTAEIAICSATFDKGENNFKSRIIGIPVFGFLDKVSERLDLSPKIENSFCIN